MSAGLYAIPLRVSARSIERGYSVTLAQAMPTKLHGNAVGGSARNSMTAVMKTTNPTSDLHWTYAGTFAKRCSTYGSGKTRLPIPF